MNKSIEKGLVLLVVDDSGDNVKGRDTNTFAPQLSVGAWERLRTLAAKDIPTVACRDRMFCLYGCGE